MLCLGALQDKWLIFYCRISEILITMGTTISKAYFKTLLICKLRFPITSTQFSMLL